MVEDGKQKRGRGRPRGKSTDKQVAFKLPKNHYDYLHHLVFEKHRFGSTVNDAARFLLVRELSALFDADYHKRTFKDD